MQIIVKDKGLNEWLENVAVAWRARFPELAEAYRMLLLHRQETLAGPSGMSKGGSLMYRAEIPQDVFYVIERKIPGFFRDPANVRKFQEYFMGDLAPKVKSNKHFISKE